MLKKLQVRKYNNTILIPDLCSICYEHYENGEDIFTLNCNHSYHYNCVMTWFITNNNYMTCPYCMNNQIEIINPITNNY